MLRAILYPLFSILALSSLCRAAPVALTESPDTYTLSNGTLTATVDKRSGNLSSLRYHDTEILNPNPRHPSGFWSHSAASDQMTTTVTIDPKSNHGQRAEVSVKGLSNGHPMGAGPGGSTVCDVEIRWSLGADDSAIYTYSTFTHQPAYPATGIGEARFCAKLNDAVFDWMTVDKDRNMRMPTAHDWNYGTPMNMKEARLLTTGKYKGHVEHKYDYSANQFDTLAWGWSSTAKHVGVWFINPTIEYLSGGPTKIELSAHRDATFNPDDKTAPAPPCLLNYWRSSHYGGANVTLAQGEPWSKTIGPFAIYCNAGPTPDAMWHDALSRSTKESAAWPYHWVRHPDYPLKEARTTVTGRLVLNDPLAPPSTPGQSAGSDSDQSAAPDSPSPIPQSAIRNPQFSGLLVGLTAPDYTAPGFRRGPQTIDWQIDAKHYQFWTRANPDGTFSIPNVRPGTYTLHAISNGVLGEFSKPNIKVDPNHPLDLGSLDWKPVRHGKQLWDIGIPDRTAGEFLHGDRAFQWGLYLQYPKDFPHDVHYTIGTSDYHKDWNLMQIPRAPADDTVGRSKGAATPWTITFNLNESPKGTATLRLAFAGTESRSLDIAVNGRNVTTLTGFMNTSSIHRDSNTSYYQTRDVPFPASLLKPGENTLTLTVPAGSITAGVMYDYLRLELDESATPPSETK